ncbi:DUF998 domain-containing protein [Actinorugispora endophytica]|uniref:Uncharacterized protein DUF998 n=1 Tax=Actinorugispora endophytica TaxID=1605990 RepID=A0A4V3D812_9ACTN|nr:DUF998 domain-containing protein [Actinorugispora endophytica]TDQ49987.1 uncharacterized protein DUF998 [Actinorugispora endophytica]
MGRTSALIAAGCYSLWLLEFGLDTGLRPSLSFVGELAAADQPYAWLFGAGDRATGVLAALAAVLGLWSGERGRWHRVGWLGLGGFGLAVAVDSFLPMDCAVSADTACAAAETAGTLSAVHAWHTVSSGLAGAAALVGAAGLAIALRGRGGRPFLAAAGVLGTQAVAMIAVLLLLSAGSGQPVEGFGLVQRIRSGGVAAWLVAVAYLPGVWWPRTGGA